MTKLSNLSAYFQNPFNKKFEAENNAAKTERLARAQRRALDLYGDKSFQEEYESIAFAASLISIFAGLISFATALFALQSILFYTVGYVLSWASAVLICGLFEALKTLIWRKTVKSKLRYKNAAPALIITLIFLHAFSLLSSGYGAYLIPTQLTPAPAKIDSTSTGALIAKADLSALENIDKQIENADKQISDLTPHILTPSGKKSAVTTKQISALQAQKDELLRQKADAKKVLTSIRENAEKEKAAASASASKDIEFIQYICLGFALFFEVVYIFCALFIFYYDFRIFVDSEAGAHLSTESATISTSTPQNAGAHLSELGAHPAPNAQTPPRKIGFFNATNSAAPALENAAPAAPAPLIFEQKYNAPNAALGVPQSYYILVNGVLVTAKVKAKIYTKDRAKSNYTAAKSKAANGEKTAPPRAAFWGEIVEKISHYEKELNTKTA